MGVFVDFDVIVTLREICLSASGSLWLFQNLFKHNLTISLLWVFANLTLQSVSIGQLSIKKTAQSIPQILAPDFRKRVNEITVILQHVNHYSLKNRMFDTSIVSIEEPVGSAQV